jgi:hypothetical protein
MPRFTITVVLALATLGALARPALADRRSFTQTYEYMTLPKGETELEFYSTQARSTWDSDTPQRFDFAVEIEHGISHHWDLALYHVFSQTAAGAESQPFGLSEIKLESRYRFAERGELPVDSLLYVEAVKLFGESVYELELKGVVARDVGALTLVANLSGEIAVGKDVDETEVEPGFAAGATYELMPALKLGAEVWGKLDLESSSTEVSVGPAVSWSPSPSLFVAGTAGFGFADADAFALSAIVGLHI